MSKIPFGIKFRPQIESGEYKVVTGDDRQVRIISWDKKVFGGRYEIVALVPTTQGDTEAVQLYCPDGTLISSNWNEKFKLFIVTPEPELTPLEDLLSTYLKNDFEYFSTKKWDEKKWNEVMRIQAAELLSLARKQLQPEIDAEIEKAFQTADEVMYRKGKEDGIVEARNDITARIIALKQAKDRAEEALKGLPRWKKCPWYFEHGDIGKTNKDDDVLSYQGYRILLSDLAKLPKED